MSTKFNFDKYNEYLKESEDKSMEDKKDTKTEKSNITKEDLRTEGDMLEKRIFGMLKPYFKKIQYMDKNIEYIIQGKQITGAIKDLKKEGYVFKNTDEILEQLETNYLHDLGFKFEKKEVKQDGGDKDKSVSKNS